jgi:uncharacterized integral membrane protein (TIGR00697 family)
MKNKITPLYMFFGILFTTCILISNTVSAKMIQVGPWTLTAGVIVFPISYILNDVVAEVYGYRAFRRIMWFGFSMNLLMVIMYAIAIALPAPVWFTLAVPFAQVLSNTPRLLVAGLIAYVFGSWTNATVLSRMKVLHVQKKPNASTNEGFSWRAILSTLFGETVDSCFFIPLAFVGNVPLDQIPMMIVLQVLVKTGYEIIVLPLTRIIVKKVKMVEAIDVVDDGENYAMVGK